MPSPDYSKEALVIEQSVTRVSFQADGNGVRSMSAVIRMQAEAAVQSLAVLRFQYSSVYETVDIDYVRVRKPDGSIVATPAYNVQEMPADVTRVAPVYSDIREKHVTVKALGVGDTLEYLVRYRTLKPQIPGQFWFEYTFTKDAIVKDDELEITVPRDKYVKVSSPDFPPQIKEDKASRTYTWKSANLERKDSTQPPKRYQPNPSVQVTTFRSWDEVGRWYRELENSQMVVTPAIRAKATELTKGAASDEERIRALYHFVSTRIHYVSLSFGIGHYQPHAAEEVLDNEYGDCKDKHTLLAALLKASGYEAWPTLISSARKLDPDVPSPAQFDHLITVVPRGNNLLWLDATPEVTPFGLLLANLRDKQALVIANDRAAALQTTPANPPFPAVLSFTADGKLDGSGVFTGHIQRMARGDAEVFFRLGFRQVPQSQWKELVQQISYRSGFGGEVSAVTASPPEDTSKPFEVSYDYQRKDYSDWANRRITPPFPPFGIEGGAQDDKKPSEPLFLGSPGEVVYRAKIELPAGSKPKLPDKVDVSDDFAEYHSSYKLDRDVLIAERRLVIKTPEIALASWDKYVKLRKAVVDDENHYIDLNIEGDDSASASANSSDPELQRLAGDAYDAYKKNDTTTAEEEFRKILTRDPKYPNAHGYLGMIALQRSRIDDGIRELLKEEEINPKELYWYHALANLYSSLKRVDEAVGQLRKVLELDPKNREAAADLGTLLINEKRYSEALQVLESANAVSPDSPSLQTLLGYAYVNTKQSAKAEAALKKAAELDPSPERLNTVAYIAAREGILPDLSRTWAEKAVSQLEAETVKTTLSDVEGGEERQANSLAAFWHTLGWVYFRNGDLGKAEKYLHAAWVLAQVPVMGIHLGQLYEKQGKPKEAAHMYELAYAAGDNQGEAAEYYKKLTGRNIEESTSPRLMHRKNSAGAVEMWPGEELSRMRTMAAPRIATKPGSAEFFVLLSSASKVEEVRFISGAEELKGAGPRLSSLKFPVEFPSSSPMRMVRRGVLTCGEAGCDFTLLLPERVRSTGLAVADMR